MQFHEKPNLFTRLLSRMSFHKATRASILANILQIAAVLSALWFVIFYNHQGGDGFLITLVAISCALVVWGAVVDIRDAYLLRKTVAQADALLETLGSVEKLNLTLRAQRHDFLNHLQVVYSLMEMHEYTEAITYIGRVYGDIRAVSGAMKTAHPAINALLSAKMGACEKQKVSMVLTITSSWEELPMPSWEMCRILGNLIDNALEAMQDAAQRILMVTLGEDLQYFYLHVSNTGPDIDPAVLNDIFIANFTTKATGEGMGLHIVRELLHDVGGDITATSGQGRTTFTARLPRSANEAHRSDL